MKYSSIDKPSLKLEVIALSIILPSGLDINPLIPANCLICAGDPLAPESAYINTLLNEGVIVSLPSLSISTLSPKAPIIELATFSFVLDHISIILLYFSPLVNKPDSNCCSIFCTSLSAFEIIDVLSSGISKSLTPIEAPDEVEYSNPKYIKLSANKTDSFKPKSLYTVAIRSRRSLFLSVLFTFSNGRPLGTISYIKHLPTVVSYKFLLSTSLTLTFTLV